MKPEEPNSTSLFEKHLSVSYGLKKSVTKSHLNLFSEHEFVENWPDGWGYMFCHCVEEFSLKSSQSNNIALPYFYKHICGYTTLLFCGILPLTFTPNIKKGALFKKKKPLSVKKYYNTPPLYRKWWNKGPIFVAPKRISRRINARITKKWH